MSGRSSPFSDVFSGVGEHFCFKEGALDFDLSSEEGDLSELGYTPPCLQTDAAYQVRDQRFRGRTMTSHALPRFDSPKHIATARKGSMIEDDTLRRRLKDVSEEVSSRGNELKDSALNSPMLPQNQQQQQKVQQHHTLLHASRKASLRSARTFHVAAYSSRILPIPSSFAMTDTSFKFTDAFWDHLEKFRTNSKPSTTSKRQLHSQRLARRCQIPFSFRLRPDENVLS